MASNFIILSMLSHEKRDSAHFLSNSVFPNSAPFGQKIKIYSSNIYYVKMCEIEKT